MNNILVVTGGAINKNTLGYVLGNHQFKTIIAVDNGLKCCKDMDIMPDVIIGDFDTVSGTLLEEYRSKAEIDTYKPEKDFTDTYLAIDKAISLHPDNVYMIGCTGSRIDHSLANLGLLKRCLDKDIKGYLYDFNNRVTLIDSTKQITLTKQEQYGKYISLVPYSDEVCGVTIRGFKYPLDEATLKLGDCVGVSNELDSNMGSISIESGYLLVIESKD